MFGKPKSGRGDWAKGLNVLDATSEKPDVIYHAGCMLSFEEDLWGVPRACVEIMNAAHVRVGVMGKQESCCGGRAYEAGYIGEFTKYAEHTIDTFNSLGVGTVVTSCSDGYSFFRNLYPKVGKEIRFRTLHLVEYLGELLSEKRVSLNTRVPLKVTYHDPCHLGRHLSPGLYDQPRDLLKAVPGLELVEMPRNRENSWCCGAGGGVSQADQGLAIWTANERLKEARATGATALVTSCPWCERNLKDAAKESGLAMPVYDVAEIFLTAIKS